MQKKHLLPQTVWGPAKKPTWEWQPHKPPGAGGGLKQGPIRLKEVFGGRCESLELPVTFFSVVWKDTQDK